MSTSVKTTRAAAAAGVKAWLTLDGVPRSQWVYAINVEPQTIGRSKYCAIRVGDPTVSREHAVVWLKAGEPFIRDLHSVNGTRVNGKRVSESPLVPGDIVRLGQVVLRVRGPEEVDATPPPAAAAPSSTVEVNPGLNAVAQLGPTDLEETAMREDLAAMYSLGGALSLCSGRAEAVQHFLFWMREWLGVERAVAVFNVDGHLRVTARSADQADPPRSIHWPTVQASLQQQELVTAELPDTNGALDQRRHVMAAWIRGSDPPGVVYGEWTRNDALWERRCRELLDAAARVLGDALVRVQGQKPGEKDTSWQLNVAGAIFVGGPAMQSVREFIRRAAGVDATVLITGETGTGKELVARSIHEQSARARGPFVKRNCGAFPEFLLENELFGHEPGSFTGATKLQKGVFDEADRGTLFLDEIGDMPLAQQAKLLHVMEQHSFQRVGGQQSVQVNVRIIAATNRDLAQAMAQSQFRRDLYYRLEVLSVCLPPLRDRHGDIRPLAEHFAALASARWGLPPAQISPEALQKLESHHWPGNIRELRNTMDRAVIFSRGASIGAEHIVILQTPDTPVPSAPSSLRLADVEEQHILQVLASVGGNKAKAATLLGIDRSTLIRKLRRLDPQGLTTS